MCCQTWNVGFRHPNHTPCHCLVASGSDWVCHPGTDPGVQEVFLLQLLVGSNQKLQQTQMMTSGTTLLNCLYPTLFQEL